MENILTPKSCEIIDIVKETDKEWTFRIASDVVPEHGQFFFYLFLRLEKHLFLLVDLDQDT